jgi:hypothetical protein
LLGHYQHRHQIRFLFTVVRDGSRCQRQSTDLHLALPHGETVLLRLPPPVNPGTNGPLLIRKKEWSSGILWHKSFDEFLCVHVSSLGTKYLRMKTGTSRKKLRTGKAGYSVFTCNELQWNSGPKSHQAANIMSVGAVAALGAVV